MEYFPIVGFRFKALHKANGLENNRKIRVDNVITNRKIMRNQERDEHRNLDKDLLNSNDLNTQNNQKDRKVLLKEWKKIKELKIKNEKLLKKPVFKVGAVKSIGFPQVSHDFVAKNIEPINFKQKSAPVVYKNLPQRVTRSQKPVASPPLPLPSRRKKNLSSIQKITPSRKSPLKKISEQIDNNSLRKTKTSLKQKNAKNVEKDNDINEKLDKIVSLNKYVNDQKPIISTTEKQISNNALSTNEKTENTANKRLTRTSRKSVSKKEKISNNVSSTDEEIENTETKRLIRTSRKSVSKKEKQMSNNVFSTDEEKQMSNNVFSTDEEKQINNNIFSTDEETENTESKRLTRTSRKSLSKKEKQISNNVFSTNEEKQSSNNALSTDEETENTETKRLTRTSRKSVSKKEKQISNNVLVTDEETNNSETNRKTRISIRKNSLKREKQISDNVLSTDEETENTYRKTRTSTRQSLSNIENLEHMRNNSENSEKQTQKSKKNVRTPKRKSVTVKENLNCDFNENEEMKKTPLNNKIINNITPENQRVYISPFVTTSRGKNSMKKENLERSLRGLPSFTKHSSLDETINSKVISAGTDYFYTVLNNEILRLQDLCRVWTEYKDSEAISECAQDLIDVAVGQANLLMAKKFKQFEGLIKACQTGLGSDRPVTCEDLQGFWDMVYIQVENLNNRFQRLTDLKKNNWEEFSPRIVSKKVKKRTRPTTIKSTASSGIRAAIQAARQKKKQTKSSPATEFRTSGGFVQVRTPHKNTPSKSAAKPTPKSILKSQKKQSLNKSTNKVVLFINDDSE